MMGILRRSRPAVAATLLVVAVACSPAETPESDRVTSTTTVVAPGDEAPEFAALNPAEGFGFLRSMSLEERPDPLDIVVYAIVPNELPRVAGVITAIPQTPLSHVNLRALQDEVPNAYIAGAPDHPAIAAHLGRYVRFDVTADGFTIEPATQAEVEAHHAASRPASEQMPERDLTVTDITELTDIGFEDWPAFGVKTANLATLGRLDLPGVEVPDGFGVPFAFYDDFMRSRGFYDEIEHMLADPAFVADQDLQQERLAALREAIRNEPMSAEAMEALAEVQARFPEGTPIRCRSSTNNEDLASFSGAGLYDSRTQHPEEGHLAKCIRQVYASTWNFRAFLAREFHRIDHLGTAMGVLLHPNFEDELVNGVAVSADPVYETADAYYVNAQVGEDLVTNPEAASVPEALLLYPQGEPGVISYSNLGEPGALLLTDEQLATLRASLSTIHSAFARLHESSAGERFAMEVEFKITGEGELAIKQARPWVFHEGNAPPQ